MHHQTESTRQYGVALQIVDDAWQELRRRTYIQLRLGETPARLPDISFEEAQRRSGIGRSLLARAARLDENALPHDLALSLRLVRFRAQIWAKEAEWYWTLIDPMGDGIFGMFLPTAYCGGHFLNLVHSQLASFRFAQAGDSDRYLALIADYARLIDQFSSRTAQQAERGIRMPKAQIPQARALLAAFRSRARKALLPERPPLEDQPTRRLMREIAERVAGEIEPAFDRALEGLADAYSQSAPEQVGISQYAGGADLYCQLVQQHTTLRLTPDQVHARGLERLARIEAAMHDIRAELGFEGDGASFIEYLNGRPEWRADTVTGITAIFERYMARLKPRFNEYFSIAPQATYGVAPLPQALQDSMTFGYFDGPRQERPTGTYLFNAKNLATRALFSIAALTYHELMPGHHLHFATQLENPTLHPFRRYSFVNSYVEGWAEYAAHLAGEIGLYEAPEERYGRLAMDAFLTCRLVVDTGMNALGWPLERARDYMRLHSGIPEAEILSETLRYSCDIPGQSLAYKLGDAHILALRDRMRASLGTRFDLKDFHAAVLGPGALPLSDLEWHLEREMEEMHDDAATGR